MKTIKATYTNGVFRPDEPVDLKEGTAVTVQLEEEQFDAQAFYASRFPSNIAPLDAAEASEMMEVIEESCELVEMADERFKSIIGVIPDEELDQMEADIQEAFDAVEPRAF